MKSVWTQVTSSAPLRKKNTFSCRPETCQNCKHYEPSLGLTSYLIHHWMYAVWRSSHSISARKPAASICSVPLQSDSDPSGRGLRLSKLNLRWFQGVLVHMRQISISLQFSTAFLSLPSSVSTMVWARALVRAHIALIFFPWPLVPRSYYLMRRPHFWVTLAPEATYYNRLLYTS